MALIRILFLLLAGIPAGTAASQQMYKCGDAGGRITYTNEACEKQGLKSVGEVRDRLTVLPTVVPAGTSAPQIAPAEKPAAKGEAADAKPAPKVKPVVPQLERLLK